MPCGSHGNAKGAREDSAPSRLGAPFERRRGRRPTKVSVPGCSPRHPACPERDRCRPRSGLLGPPRGAVALAPAARPVGTPSRRPCGVGLRQGERTRGVFRTGIPMPGGTRAAPSSYCGVGAGHRGAAAALDDSANGQRGPQAVEWARKSGLRLSTHKACPRVRIRLGKKSSALSPAPRIPHSLPPADGRTAAGPARATVLGSGGVREL